MDRHLSHPGPGEGDDGAELVRDPSEVNLHEVGEGLHEGEGASPPALDQLRMGDVRARGLRKARGRRSALLDIRGIPVVLESSMQFTKCELKTAGLRRLLVAAPKCAIEVLLMRKLPSPFETIMVPREILVEAESILGLLELRLEFFESRT